MSNPTEQEIKHAFKVIKNYINSAGSPTQRNMRKAEVYHAMYSSLPSEVVALSKRLEKKTSTEAGALQQWHVTYYYLATGMEGRADTHDYGVVLAATAEEARRIVAKRESGPRSGSEEWWMSCLSAEPWRG